MLAMKSIKETETCRSD